jgi:hypothetical protein
MDTFLVYFTVVLQVCCKLMNHIYTYCQLFIMINIKQECMSQNISFKQPNKYSKNSPEGRILNLEFQIFSKGQIPPRPPPKIAPSALDYFLLFKIAVHLFSKKLSKTLMFPSKTGQDQKTEKSESQCVRTTGDRCVGKKIYYILQ